MESIPEDASALNWHSWMAVLQADADEAACRLALRQAETACRLIPNHGSFLNTLGVAQYRLGMFEEAIRSLTQADQINRASQPGSNPADLAFLSMAENRLGRRDQALRCPDPPARHDEGTEVGPCEPVPRSPGRPGARGGP